MKSRILILSFGLACMAMMSVSASCSYSKESKIEDEKPSLGMSHSAEVSFTHIDQFADLVPTVIVANMSGASVVKTFPTLEKHINFCPSAMTTWTSRFSQRAERSPHA